DLGAGAQVVAMDLGDELRLREVEQVVVALHVAGPVGEALTAVTRLIRAVTLDGSPHGAVEDDDVITLGVRQGSSGVRTPVQFVVHAIPRVQVSLREPPAGGGLAWALCGDTT